MIKIGCLVILSALFLSPITEEKVARANREPTRTRVSLTEIKSVHLTAIRTIVEDENASKHDSYGGDERTQSILRHSEMRIEWTLNSDTVAASDAPDNFDLIVYGDPKYHQNGTHPLKGSGKSDWQFNSDEKISLGGCTYSHKKAGKFSADGKLKDAELSFGYEPGKEEGDFRLDLPFNNATGNGTEHVESSGCNDQGGDFDESKVGAAEMDMLLTLFGVFTARNKPLDMSFLGEDAVKGAQLAQETLDNTGMGGYCTITASSKCGGNYDISYNTSKVINALDEGWSGSATRTVTTQVHISISGQQKQYDAIIEPYAIGDASGDYQKWIPEGPKVDSNDRLMTSKGNSISFKLLIVDKANPNKPDPNVKYDVEYSLTKGSNEPGYCNNFPSSGADQKWDLRFDSSMNYLIGTGLFSDTLVKSHDLQGKTVMPIVASYDYGSFAKLRAKVVLECGQVLEAHLRKDNRTEISIPMDNNDNQISDEWEKQMKIFGSNIAPDEDKDDLPKELNPAYSGDGFTVFEEYRGFIEKGKHIRTDPKKRDVMVCNMIKDRTLISKTMINGKEYGFSPNDETESGIGLFKTVTGLEVHDQFTKQEFGRPKILPGEEQVANTYGIQPFGYDRCLNFNVTSHFHRVDQHGLVIVASPKNFGYAIAESRTGAAFPNTPKGFYFLVITADFKAGKYSTVRADMIGDSLQANPNGKAKVIVNEYAVTIAHEMLHCVHVLHHGDTDPPDVIWYRVKDKDGAYKIIESEYTVNDDGTPQITTGTQIHPHWNDDAGTEISVTDPLWNRPWVKVFFGIEGGQHSGVENCIMRYDIANAFKRKDGTRYLMKTETFIPPHAKGEETEKIDYYREMTGTELCTTKKGTGVNDKNYKPRFRYGDATNGNCKSQVKVNDKD